MKYFPVSHRQLESISSPLSAVPGPDVASRSHCLRLSGNSLYLLFTFIKKLFKWTNLWFLWENGCHLAIWASINDCHGEETRSDCSASLFCFIPHHHHRPLRNCHGRRMARGKLTNTCFHLIFYIFSNSFSLYSNTGQFIYLRRQALNLQPPRLVKLFTVT